jgi:hypothetical protein
VRDTQTHAKRERQDLRAKYFRKCMQDAYTIVQSRRMVANAKGRELSGVFRHGVPQRLARRVATALLARKHIEDTNPKHQLTAGTFAPEASTSTRNRSEVSRPCEKYDACTLPDMFTHMALDGAAALMAELAHTDVAPASTLATVTVVRHSVGNTLRYARGQHTRCAELRRTESSVRVMGQWATHGPMPQPKATAMAIVETGPAKSSSCLPKQTADWFLRE